MTLQDLMSQCGTVTVKAAPLLVLIGAAVTNDNGPDLETAIEMLDVSDGDLWFSKSRTALLLRIGLLWRMDWSATAYNGKDLERWIATLTGGDAAACGELDAEISGHEKEQE